MKAYEKFNNSAFGCWINSGTGRIFRLLAGVVFLVLGIIYFKTNLGIASLIWSFFPLSAGIFNLCWISAALGGPLSGSKITQSKSQS